MIIVTSVSPGHKNFRCQTDCIQSWQEYANVYSLNCASEIHNLQTSYSGVEFVETNRTMIDLFQKPLINVKTIIDFANSKNEDLFLINSDILIETLPPLKYDGITILSRYDYHSHISDSKMFVYGFDAFFIPKKFMYIFYDSIYCLGQCWWDLWVPYVAINNNIPVYWPSGKHIYHKLHDVQYSYEQWCFIGEQFKKEFRLDKNLSIPQIATMVMAKIKAHIV